MRVVLYKSVPTSNIGSYFFIGANKFHALNSSEILVWDEILH